MSRSVSVTLRHKPKFGGQLPLALLTAALVVLGAWPAAPVEAARAKVRNPEDLMIVDCLLPGQVRRLGRQASFMSARRPIRTTQADCQIRGGEYVAFDRANYQTALKVWMDQAMAGSAEAQNYVGEIYAKGLGIAPDYAMAAQWFRKSAEQGERRAKINLGYLYEEGLGVAQDLGEALRLYREASGTQDELLFASAVQVQMQAKESQISELQQSVAQERESNEQLREKVQKLESQMHQRQDALRKSERELQDTRRKLDQARNATGADLSKLDEMKQTASQLQASNAELRRREAETRQHADELEKQLAALRQQEQNMRASGATQGELADLKAQGEALAKTLDDAQAQAHTMQQSMAVNDQRLKTQQAHYEAEIARLQAEAEGRKKDDWELLKLLEGQLSQKEAEVRQQRDQIASLQQQISVDQGGQLIAAATPTLEILNPPLTVTRGSPAAVLRGPPGPSDLVGRVSSPQGLAQLTVNGQPVGLDSGGLFRSRVDVAPGGTRVEIAARARSGAVASLDFLMLPQAGATASSANSSGQQTAAAERKAPGGAKLGRFYALVIGNDSYQSERFQRLGSAGNDAAAVADLLRKRYGYDTRLLLNAGRMEMLTALNEMREKLQVDDNLLLYYAGHGDIDTASGEGYWVPVDALPGRKDTWVSNAAVSSILDTMKARHVLVVADSCYSGTMTRSSVPIFNDAVMAPKQWSKWVDMMNAGRSRTALTSGAVQPVLDSGAGDHSYFAGAFLRVLQNNNGLLEAQRLFREVSSSMALAAIDAPIDQTPQYAPIRFSGHESGDFFFVPKG